MRRRIHLLAAALALIAPMLTAAPAEAQPVEPPLSTPWTDEVSPDNALPEYPRPQLTRDDWLNLNGTWEWEPAEPGEAPPIGRELEREILVPYPVESALSGIAEQHSDMWYRRSFTVPEDWAGRDVQLNFGAVDWRATVWVNGTEVGTHTGGYTAFELDITDALRPGGNEVVVGVHDPSDAGGQPVGKQRLDTGDGDWSIWYTTNSGIWQTVWLEPVAPAHLDRLDTTPDLGAGTLEVVAHTAAAGGHTVRATASTPEGRVVGTAQGAPGEPVAVPVPDARLWWPDDPYLYDLTVQLLDGSGAVVDEVGSYFGMREISTGMVDGVRRPLLNGEFVFQLGPLDQGYWPDGIYTAPTDEALRFDIEATRDLGFNTIRKHVKLEPARWYYWADRLGLLVMQDMPTMDGEPGAAERAQFEAELTEMIDQRRSHPSIIQWVPFNEGWGQYDGARIVEDIQRRDPSRLVVGASGWHDTGNGDAHDIHIYPGPTTPVPTSERAAYLGEFGGSALLAPGHQWDPERGGGYEVLPDAAALTERYESLLGRVAEQVDTHGLSAAIYTQTTDVENELNGLLTYDRRIVKPDADRVRAANQAVLDAAAPSGLGMGAWFRLENRNSGQVLAVDGMSTEDGAQVTQWPDNGTADHRWRLVNNGDGTFRIVNDHSDRVLAVDGMSTQDGAAVEQYRDAGTADQRWRLEDTGDGYVRIVNVHSGLRLDIAGSSTENGAHARQRAAHGGASQQWRLMPDGEVNIQNLNSGRVLDVFGASHDNGARLTQWWDSQVSQQNWRFEDSGDGYFRVVSTHSGNVMEVLGWSTANSAQVVQWDWHGGANQQWRLLHDGDGYFHLQNRHSGLLLAVEGASAFDDADIHQYEDNGTRDHVWRFTP
nr:RICIN domain-containing protein [Allonocardiopsis opalescens]